MYGQIECIHKKVPQISLIYTEKSVNISANPWEIFILTNYEL